MPTISYRFATEDDAVFITELQNAFIENGAITAQLEPYTVEDRRGWLAAHTPTRRPCWLMLCDGQNAGMVSLSDFHPRAAYAITAEITIYLHPAFLHQGLGAQVLAFAEAQAPALGIENLAALIYHTNTASLALFGKCGYAEAGFLADVARHPDGYRSLSILIKRLKANKES